MRDWERTLQALHALAKWMNEEWRHGHSYQAKDHNMVYECMMQILRDKRELETGTGP